MSWRKKRNKKWNFSIVAIIAIVLILALAYGSTRQHTQQSTSDTSSYSPSYINQYKVQKINAKSMLQQDEGIILIKPSRVVVIDEGFPESNQSTEKAIYLDGGIGNRKQKRALVQFDLSELKNTSIEAVYLRLFNSDTLEINAIRTLQVKSVKKPWTKEANWLTYDGTHPWTAPGGMMDESENGVSQTVFRIVRWEPSWFLDVTPMIKEWIAGAPNYGFTFSADDEMSLMPGNKENTAPTLIIQTKPVDKIASALQSLKFNFSDAPFADPNIGVVNALVNADRLGLGEEYLISLEKYYSSVLDEEGHFSQTAQYQFQNYYVTGFGPSLIYLYEKTGKEKYINAVKTLLHLLSPEKMNKGLFVEDKHDSVQTELAMFAIPFLAEYGNHFNDKDSLDLAMDQMIKLLDATTSREQDFLPITYVYDNGGVGKGWARGVGYLFAGLGKLLSYDKVKEHPDYTQLENSYKRLASAIFKYRVGGMWRGLMQNKTSPVDTSGSSLIAIGYEYGVRNGILKIESYRIVDEALYAITKYSKTGFDLNQSFPPNQDLTYRITQFGATRHALGYWLELITLVSGR